MRPAVTPAPAVSAVASAAAPADAEAAAPLRVTPLLLGWLLLATVLRAQAASATTLEANAITGLLQRLDALFAAGAIDGYLATFEPDHPGAHAVHGRHLGQLFRGDGTRRSSAIVGEPRRIGPRTVVLVEHRIDWPPPSAVGAAAAATQHHVENCVYALRAGPDGNAVPTLAVEVPARSDCVQRDRFRCPPCNYEIGGVDGWLCLPVPAERAHALEAATFYLLGTAVACDVSVQVAASPERALVVAARLGDAVGSLDDTARVGPALPWLPPAHRTPAATAHGAEPRSGHFDGAQLEIELPSDLEDDGGGRMVFHVVTYGGLQHLLLVRGSREQLDRRRADVDALLASYRLLEDDRDPGLATSRPLLHHTGGSIDGATYRNELFGVVLQGPADWRGQIRSGGAAFRVFWSSDAGGHLWLTGHTVPTGMRGWCRATADRWLQHLCARRGLRLADADGDGRWIESTNGTASRTVIASATAAAPPAAAERRLVHVRLHNDLLLVVEGLAATPADEAALRRAIDSLRRR